MAQLPHPYSCDICGVIKKDSNNWWYAITTENGWTISPWDYPAMTDDPEVKHLCGIGCATKKLSEFMNAEMTRC